MSLFELNRLLSAWVKQYHHTTHSALEETPAQRYGRFTQRRILNPEYIHQAFLQWDIRSISTTGEVKFAGNRYHVDPSWAGRKKAVIRYDPYDLSVVYLWESGRIIGRGAPQRLITRQWPRRQPKPATTSEAALRYLETFEEAHRAGLAQELNLIRYQDTPEDPEKPEDSEKS